MFKISNLPHRVKIVTPTLTKGRSGSPKESATLEGVGESAAWVFETKGPDFDKPVEGVVVEAKIYLSPDQQITIRDRIHHGSKVYEVIQVRNPCGVSHHIAVHCRRMDR